MNNEKIIAEERAAVIEVDFWSLCRTLWHRVWILLLAAVIAAAAVYSLSDASAPTSYKSSYSVYAKFLYDSLQDKDGNIVSSTDAKDTSSLLEAYNIIVNNSRVLLGAAEKAGISGDAESLRSMVNVQTNSSNSLITVEVTSSSEQGLREFASALNELSAQETSSRLENSMISTVENASAPVSVSYSKKTVKAAVLAAVITFFAAAAFVVIYEIFRDKIKSEAQLERRCNILVLGSVPNHRS